MSRSTIISTIQSRGSVAIALPTEKLTEYYAANVFNYAAIKQFCTTEAFNAIKNAGENSTPIDRKLANDVAEGMKQWALSKNVTHYTHWFQPLTGTTAEKHDAFFEPDENGNAIEIFNGKALVQQEPDASSFPSGGIRNTFEARGYTAWDPSSPAFIMEYESGNTLCIPTVFVSYTGEALDYKTPLLKALNAVDKATVAVAQYFDKKITKTWSSLGIEQEYFLIDEAFYNARPDLVLSGRTLFGAAPAKGQQLEDHYFGAIPERIHSFMVDFETEALKLGIPLKTRHNEVAPSQYECAPMFEEINLAVDHNQLLMDLMEKISRKHKLKVLFHEKPFAGINGSGKHNNWSLITNTGVNLLSPGQTPQSNLLFLTIFVNVIKAVHDNADLLRASIASAANDFRLGANEAPPAIMSVFVGTQLHSILNDIEKSKPNAEARSIGSIKIDKIPEILLDNTDRNRTSPFAFTGNKFEFRAVGSSANSANAMTVLNTIVADTLKQFKLDVDTFIKKGKNKEEAIMEILRSYIKKSKNIIFEGNGYSDEWVKEAAKRGLSNIKTTPKALDAYVSLKSEKMFIENKVFNKRELHARHEIMLETYIKKVQIEARVMGDMAYSTIIPAALQYQKVLIDSVVGMKAIGIPKSKMASQMAIINEINDRVTSIKEKVDKMIGERVKANKMIDTYKKAIAYCDKVKTFFDPIREDVDKLEFIVADNYWQLPKYREMLFIR
jgi:glutamine synthetase